MKDAAGYICRSQKTLRRMCQARELPHTRLHGRLLIERRDLDDFLAGCKVQVIDHTAALRGRV